MSCWLLILLIYLDRKYKLGVIIDLHAAPGSQNPWEHSSSRDGTQEWGTTDANIAQTVQVIDFLASRSHKDVHIHHFIQHHIHIGNKILIRLLLKFLQVRDELEPVCRGADERAAGAWSDTGQPHQVLPRRLRRRPEALADGLRGHVQPPVVGELHGASPVRQRAPGRGHRRALLHRVQQDVQQLHRAAEHRLHQDQLLRRAHHRHHPQWPAHLRW